MRLSKKIRIIVLAGFVVFGALYLAEMLSIPGAPSVTSTAEAVVGRPVTPVSVAGVARRTSRRN